MTILERLACFILLAAAWAVGVSRKMSPLKSVGNPANLSLADSISKANFPLCHASGQGAYRDCVAFTYLCQVAPLSKFIPFLFDHIANVVSLRSKKEMTWIHACRSIAPMKDVHSAERGPLADYHGHSVRVHFPEAHAWASYRYQSVSISIGAICPFPAFSKPNLGPETFKKALIVNQRKRSIFLQHLGLRGAVVLGGRIGGHADAVSDYSSMSSGT